MFEAHEIMWEYLQSIGSDVFPAAVRDEVVHHLDGDAAIFLARSDDTVAGCILTHRLRGDDFEIKRMYVRPAFRRLGLAGRLMDAAEAFARSCGASGVYLDSRTTMTAALRLYGERGYSACEAFKPVHRADVFFFKSLGQQ